MPLSKPSRNKTNQSETSRSDEYGFHRAIHHKHRTLSPVYTRKYFNTLACSAYRPQHVTNSMRVNAHSVCKPEMQYVSLHFQGITNVVEHTKVRTMYIGLCPPCDCYARKKQQRPLNPHCASGNDFWRMERIVSHRTQLLPT